MQDKRVLITGASRGLGAIAAVDFAERGAKVALLARSIDDLEKVRQSCSQPECHTAIAVDLTDANAISDAVLSAGAFLGGFDCVLHVAGGGLGLREALLSATDISKLFTLNVAAAAEINRLVAPSMLQSGSGSLVHVGSIAGSESTGSVGYNTVKAALSGYVRSLGNELAGSGIVATGILPGGFFAPGNAFDRLGRSKPEAVNQFIEDRLPRKRLADASEVVALLRFLSSDEASMMGGCMVPIDAGEGSHYVGA